MHTFLRRSRVLFVAAGVVVLACGLAGCEPQKGYAGMCKGDDALTGTTVVVDFQELDGNAGRAAPMVVRCSPNPGGQPRTGLEAMQDAGITPTGVQRWGLAFICRINGRPAADEELPVNGNPQYQEKCVNTPPASAYWSYWYADGGGSQWTYSSYGVMNRNAIPGGFEGWSFSLNRTASTNPKPHYTPRNPAVDPDATAVSLSVDDLDRSITLGQTTTLSWTSKRATSVRATGVTPAGGGTWSGTLAVPSGSRSVKPTKKGTFTYEVTASGAKGSVTSTATLTVR